MSRRIGPQRRRKLRIKLALMFINHPLRGISLYGSNDPAPEVVYGFPCVENPNDFVPDGECDSAEFAAWEEAKRRWDAGERDVRGPHSGWISPDIHVTMSSWGIGMNIIRE